MSANLSTDLDIARAAKLRPIAEIAAKLDIPADNLFAYGPHIAKVDPAKLPARDGGPGKLVLVTAITPTPAGEGKTTTTVGLGDALSRIGKRTAICLREPSLGPCFGLKGGAAGGGYAQVLPMDKINLHFTGDFHAVSAAHNLLSAMIDNHIYWGNELGLDPRRISWRRVVDMNDRALRQINQSLGGVANGFPREDGFDITVASEVMAILCLAEDMADLAQRLGQIIVGLTRDRQPVTAADLKAPGPMAVLLKDALQPNLVQTLEGNPAFVHGGPFANIAHGCNSVIATKAALGIADYVVTEAGFGADLGAEKFFNIKCRKAGLDPAAAVLVATVRALKMHGGVARGDLGEENVAAVEAGLTNLARHCRNLKSFGVPVVVCINRFTGDTDAEVEAVRGSAAGLGVEVVLANHWADGGAGAEDLAHAVVKLAESGAAQFSPLYDDAMPLWDKIKTVATRIYGADDIIADKVVRTRIQELDDQAYGRFPVCMAKTQYSFSTDPSLKGAPSGHVVPIREVRLSGGAEFIVALCGQIMTMPGLPRTPAAEGMGIDEAGEIFGLF